MLKLSDIKPYIREYALPSIWCPGCGHGVFFKAALHAMANLGLDKDDIVVTCGIGCSARAAYYCDVNGIRTPHGRALAFATGAKVHRPDTKHILFLGDGDCAGIGGNHLIHAARRNIDLTVLVLNNSIYGMTGGQVSPTTPFGDRTTTTVHGNIEEAMNICELAMASGATFVARTTAFHVPQAVGLIERAILHNGFSLIEGISPCPTSYGRRNNYPTAVSMYEHLREEQAKGKIFTGILCDKTQKEYTVLCRDLIEREKALGKQDELLLPVINDGSKLPCPRFEILLSGTGGQGLITAGIMLAEAGIRSGKNSVQTQSYGPESRGGASRSQVVFSDNEIWYPEVISPDALLVMSQQACSKYVGSMKEGSIALVDTTFVDDIPETKAAIYSLPLTRIAVEEAGNKIVANVVATSVLACLTDLVPQHLLEQSVVERVPDKARDINLSAISVGYRYGNQLKEEMR